MAHDIAFRPEDNFETEKMIKKMKGVLRAKKTKAENYKNIELFENIYESNGALDANVEPFTATNNTTIDDLLNNVDLNVDLKSQLENIKQDLSGIKDVATSKAAYTYVDNLIQPIVRQYTEITSFWDAKCKKPVLPYIPFFTNISNAMSKNDDTNNLDTETTDIPSQVDDYQNFDKSSKTSVFDMGDIPGIHPLNPDTGHDPNKNKQKCTACNDWTGMDDIDDTGETDGDLKPANYLIQWVDYFHDSVLFVECIIARNITKWLSGTEFIEGDVDIVKKYVTWGLVIYISGYVVYNWFYLTFFKEYGEKMKIFEISEKNYEQFSEKYPALSYIDSFITPSIFFTEQFHNFFLHWLPALNEKDHLFDAYFSPTFMFVILYFLTIFVLYYYLDYFYKALINILRFDFTNPLVLILFAVTACVLLYKVAKSWTMSKMDTSLFNPQKLFEMVIKKLGGSNPLILFMYAIATFLYVMFVLTYTPFLASLLFVVSLFLFLFFYMALFTQDGYIQNCYDINHFINTVLFKNKKEKMSVKLSILENVKILLNIIFDFFYKHLFECSIFFMILCSFFDYAKLKSGTLKLWLYILNFCVLVLIALYSIYTYLVPKNAGLETFEEVMSDNPAKQMQPNIIIV